MSFLSFRYVSRHTNDVRASDVIAFVMTGEDDAGRGINCPRGAEYSILSCPVPRRSFGACHIQPYVGTSALVNRSNLKIHSENMAPCDQGRCSCIKVQRHASRERRRCLFPAPKVRSDQEYNVSISRRKQAPRPVAGKHVGVFSGHTQHKGA